MWSASIGKTLALLLIPSLSLLAQWTTDSETNTPVCIAHGWQSPAALISDGYQGAYAVWFDDRIHSPTPRYDVYAQRIFSTGKPAWPNNGLKIMSGATFYMHFVLLPVPEGGFLMAYENVSNEPSGEVRHISIIKVNRHGSVNWRQNRVFPYSHVQGRTFTAVSDGDGGAYIFQSYGDSTDTGNIYGQHIDNGGSPRWTFDGVCIADGPGGQFEPVAALGHDDHVYVAWEDDNNFRGSNRYNEIFLQRLTSSGTKTWPEPGVRVTPTKNRYGDMKLHCATSGTVIVVWPDARNVHPETSWITDDTARVYAQSISPSGNKMWDATGVDVSFGMPIRSTGNGDVQSIQVDSDNNSGIVVSWCNNAGDFFAQRIASNGLRVYNYRQHPRLLFNNQAHAFYRYGMTGDMDGGLFITYLTELDGKSFLKAVHVNSGGNVDWTDTPVGSSPGSKDITFGSVLPHLISDDHGGFIAAWSDGRDDNGDVYIARFARDGNPFPVELTSFLGQRIGSNVLLEWDTEHETNNRGFAVERSFGEEHWVEVGFVDGHGTDGSPHSYAFNDEIEGFTMPGTLRYRLRQVDFSGRYTYSPIVTIALAEAPPKPLLLSVHPNPASTQAVLDFVLPQPAAAKFTLLNAAGQAIHTAAVACPSGSQSYSLPMHPYPSGVYFLRMTTEFGTTTHSIVKH